MTRPASLKFNLKFRPASGRHVGSGFPHREAGGHVSGRYRHQDLKDILKATGLAFNSNADDAHARLERSESESLSESGPWMAPPPSPGPEQ